MPLHPRPRVGRAFALAGTLFAGALAACVSVARYDTVRATLPADRLVAVGAQLVHVETAGPRDAEAVVLLHGFGGSTYMFRHLLPALRETHRVVAIDLNGFGWTERPRDEEAYTRGGQARMVLGVLDALAVARAHVVGHSYGGAIASDLATRHPARVRTLVFVAGAAPTYPDERRGALARFTAVAGVYVRAVALRERGVRKALLGSVADDRLVTDELVREYTRRLRVEGVERAFRGLTAPRPREPEIDLAALRMPILMLWGSHDTLIPPAGARRTAERIGARFELLDGVGHLPTEEAPQEVLAHLRAWLAEHREPR